MKVFLNALASSGIPYSSSGIPYPSDSSVAWINNAAIPTPPYSSKSVTSSPESYSAPPAPISAPPPPISSSPPPPPPTDTPLSTAKKSLDAWNDSTYFSSETSFDFSANKPPHFTNEITSHKSG